MNSNRVGYRGYVTCRSFGGLQIPIHIQSAMMRDYCARHGYRFALHVNENIFPASYLVLERLIGELDIYEGVLATSMFMMPMRAERRRRIYDAILTKGATLHFIVEDIVIRNRTDIEPVEEILWVYGKLPQAPSSQEVAASI